MRVRTSPCYLCSQSLPVNLGYLDFERYPGFTLAMCSCVPNFNTSALGAAAILAAAVGDIFFFKKIDEKMTPSCVFLSRVPCDDEHADRDSQGTHISYHISYRLVLFSPARKIAQNLNADDQPLFALCADHADTTDLGCCRL